MGTLVGSSYGVTQYERYDNLKFVTKAHQLRSSIELPSKSKVELIRIPYKKLITRIKKGTDKGEVEPVRVYIPKNELQMKMLIAKLARKGQYKPLLERVIDKMSKADPTSSSKVKITVTKDDLMLMKPKELANILSKPHHNVTINSRKLFKNRPLRKKFFKQLKGFIDREDRYKIYGKLRRGVDLVVEDDMLPPFAKQMIRKFLVVRGPNCFHAALSFHGQKFTRSPFFNIKIEHGYHKAMINYDELWRTITRNFYEVNTDIHNLKYGDILVFFDVPDRLGIHESVNFRWIRHTAIFLFGQYTFSKGSKSPSTPYSIKTINDEWRTWTGYSKNLGLKVFRRNSKRLKKAPPFDLTDWIY